jgi:heme/copper-type cytochrome/quinol oxidase subunit 2
MTGELTTLPGRAVGFVLATAGLAALVWGAVALATGRLVAIRLVVAVALASLVALVAAFTLDPSGNSVFAVAAAVLLLMVVAAWCAVAARRSTGAASRSAVGGSGVVAILLAAVAVAGLVTPALAATELARVSADSGGTVTVLDRTGHGH